MDTFKHAHTVRILLYTAASLIHTNASYFYAHVLCVGLKFQSGMKAWCLVV